MTFRERTLKHLGIFPQSVPLKISFEKEQKFDGYTGHIISYNLEHNERVRSILLIPDSILISSLSMQEPKIKPKTPQSSKKHPAILAIHQHNGEYHLGKAEPAAWDINGKIIDLNPMYAYGRDLAKKGYIVICPDLLCFEERFDPYFGIPQNSGLTYEVFEFTKRIQQGSSLQAKYLHDMSKAIDVLCDLEYVDTSRIGVIGHSLGGQTTLYTTWYDERVKVGVSSCGFGTMETIIRNKVSHNKAAYIPGFSTYADTYDTLCDIAPRAFAFTSGVNDYLFPIDGVREIEQKAKQKYAELNASDKFMTHIFDGGHCFDDEAKEKVYAFLERL